jgi:Flp pilus assembly protein TadD/5-hydroxyisourate hydrolase-like protein (transthyretin family)
MRTFLWRAVSIGIVLVWLVAEVSAQSVTTLRGKVVDEQGRPLPGVTVEMEFRGESRQKIVKSVVTDKKGGWVRAGLLAGPWTLRFSKEGFKTAGLDTNVSLGIFSEIPEVTLHATPTAAPAGASSSELGPATGRAPAPPEAAGVYNKAVEALNAGNDGEAESLFKQVIESAPAAAPAYYNLGYLYMKKKDVPAAEAAFRKAIELRPQEANAYVALSTLLGSAGRPEEALGLLQGAAGSFAEDARFQFVLGVAAINAGRDADAEPALQKAAALDPANAEVQYYLGTLAVGRNEIPAAVEHLERYLALAPQGPNAEVARKLLEAVKKGR